jgi:hypothetical protein
MYFMAHLLGRIIALFLPFDPYRPKLITLNHCAGAARVVQWSQPKTLF